MLKIILEDFSFTHFIFGVTFTGILGIHIKKLSPFYLYIVETFHIENLIYTNWVIEYI